MSTTTWIRVKDAWGSIRRLVRGSEPLAIEPARASETSGNDIGCCRASECWRALAVASMKAEEYTDLEDVLRHMFPVPPPGDWASYCQEHLQLFLVTHRWDPKQPLWRSDLISCRVDGCPGVGGEKKSRGGQIMGIAGDLLDGLCLIHRNSFSVYGAASPPRSLVGRKPCEQPIDMLSDVESDPPRTRQCREPQVANGLCLLHVIAGQGGRLDDARQVLATWDDDYQEPAIEFCDR